MTELAVWARGTSVLTLLSAVIRSIGRQSVDEQSAAADDGGVTKRLDYDRPERRRGATTKGQQQRLARAWFLVGPKGVVIPTARQHKDKTMYKRKTVHVSQLLPEPRKRPWWKHGGKGLIGLLKTVLKLLGLVLKLLNVLGTVAKEIKKLIDLIWPG